MNNPALIRQMMENPLVQQMMSNPEIMRQMMLSNPQMRELMEVGFSSEIVTLLTYIWWIVSVCHNFKSSCPHSTRKITRTVTCVWDLSLHLCKLLYNIIHIMLINVFVRTQLFFGMETV